MKKIISIFLVLLVLISISCSLTVNAIESIDYVSKDGLWKYCAETTLGSTKYYVYEYLGTNKNITLPSKIDGIIPTICTMCYNDNIESITIPSNYTDTYDYAFAGCDNLIEVIFDSENTKVHLGSYTFSGDKKLETVVLPKYLKNEKIWDSQYGWRWAVSLPDDIFYNCKKLKNVTLPENLTEIGGEAFYNCSSLEEFVVPEGVKTIGSYAFSYCSSLKSLSFPKSLENIGAYSGYPATIPKTTVIIANPESKAYEYLQLSTTNSNNLLLPSTPSKIIGDLNNDGSVNITDVTLLQKIIAGIYDITLSNSDVDSNEKVNINDATAIQKIIAGIIIP